MDFGALPPEMNSARIYSGPGPGSLFGAAAAWDATADELYAAASAGHSVVAALASDGWLSQASMSMTAAASTYDCLAELHRGAGATDCDCAAGRRR